MFGASMRFSYLLISSYIHSVHSAYVNQADLARNVFPNIYKMYFILTNVSTCDKLG